MMILRSFNSVLSRRVPSFHRHSKSLRASFSSGVESDFSDEEKSTKTNQHGLVKDLGISQDLVDAFEKWESPSFLIFRYYNFLNLGNHDYHYVFMIFDNFIIY
jgi:hypothetical protein